MDRWHVVCEYVCVYIYIYIEVCVNWVQVTLCIILTNITSLNNLLLNVNFDKFTNRLHYIHILPMLKISRSSNINSHVINNYLNSSFYNLK